MSTMMDSVAGKGKTSAREHGCVLALSVVVFGSTPVRDDQGGASAAPYRGPLQLIRSDWQPGPDAGPARRFGRVKANNEQSTRTSRLETTRSADQAGVSARSAR